jgi:hypothetical protein
MAAMIMLLRAALTLTLLGLIAYAGFTHQTYGSIALLFSTLFTLAYIDGKLEIWKASIRESSPLRLLLNIATTFCIQLLVVSALYFIAFGISSTFFGVTGKVPVSTPIFGTAGAIAGALIALRLFESLRH